jgi:hypothetical protein
VLAAPVPGGDWLGESCRAHALGRRGGLASVPPLLEILDHADRAPRVAAWESLTRITGQRLPPTKEAWAAWWAARDGAPGSAPAPAAAGSDRYRSPPPVHVPRHYGIPLPRPVEGGHVVFCLDLSQSMYGRALDAARRELVATVKDLTTRHAFEVVAFNEHVTAWAGRLVRAHPIVKARLVDWIQATEPLSYTNLYDAVETAFGYAGRGRHPAAEPSRLDAVFLLSDGAPNRGRYRDPARIVPAVVALAEGRVPVHTIGAGDEAFPLLRAIADATGGTFVNAFE